MPAVDYIKVDLQGEICMQSFRQSMLEMFSLDFLLKNIYKS